MSNCLPEKQKEKSQHNPYFCFPCGKFFKDITKHEKLKSHTDNFRKWQKRMEDVLNV
jgi:hypothetical protein